MFATSYGELQSPSSHNSPFHNEPNSPLTQQYTVQPQKMQQKNEFKRPSVNVAANKSSAPAAEPRSPLVADDPLSPKQSHVFTFPVAKTNSAAEAEQKKASKEEKKSNKNKRNSNANNNTKEGTNKDSSSNKAELVVPFHMRIPSLDAIELRSFLNQVVAPGFLLQLVIKRNKSGVMNSLYPSYEVYHEASGIQLMSGRKKPGNKTSNFEINVDKQYRTSGYLGKVRGNFTGSEYIIYDNGVNPKKLKDINSGQRRAREELCIVRFDNNIMGQCPRSLTAAMPQVELDEETGIVTRRMWKPLSQTASMMERFKKDPEQSK
jgi:hypothetical protein